MDERKMNSAQEIIHRKSIPITECGCWLWEGAGVYGRVTFDNKRIYAHRLAYAAFKGLIPSDNRIIHKCHIPCCVNPDHLDLANKTKQPTSV